MGKYIHFTEEEKQTANNVNLEEFLRTRGETLITSGREKRLASDHSITIRGNEWFDHSTERGGYAIDFVKQFYQLRFPEAVTLLLEGGIGYRPPPAEKRKPFALPPANNTMRRVWAYLTKTRDLSPDIVKAFAKENLLYESLETTPDGKIQFHNAIFVGVDDTGQPRHGHKCGLRSDGNGFKGTVESSNPAYSFHRIGQGDTLHVFESPIDLLSYLSLHPTDWQKESYVALCGLSGQAFRWILQTYPHIQTVCLCLDNDTPGQRACEKFRLELTEQNCTVHCHIPKGKDWNEDLIRTHQTHGYGMKLE